MDRERYNLYYQDDPVLNKREAWPAEEFPQAAHHYFRESGCIMTSLWNMCLYYGVRGVPDSFQSPWELNEACKEKGAFYTNANIELGRIDRVLSIEYTDRVNFDEAELQRSLDEGTMCLLRVKGINGRYHYVLPFADEDGGIRCFDPKAGYTDLGHYEAIYQIIRFAKREEPERDRMSTLCPENSDN